MSIKYALYGSGCIHSITHEQIMEEAKHGGNIIARAESSGCEGEYVEIAKWNEDNKRWERYAFEKFFGGELHDCIQGAEQTAELLAAQINERNRLAPLIHSLPNWGTKKEG